MNKRKIKKNYYQSINLHILDIVRTYSSPHITMPLVLIMFESIGVLIIWLIFRTVFKLRLIVIILSLSMFQFPFLELSHIFWLHSGLYFVHALQLKSVLATDDILEFGHLEIDSLKDLWFRNDTGEFVDFVEFGFEFLEDFWFFLVFELESLQQFGLFGFHIVMVGKFFPIILVLFLFYH